MLSPLGSGVWVYLHTGHLGEVSSTSVTTGYRAMNSLGLSPYLPNMEAAALEVCWVSWSGNESVISPSHAKHIPISSAHNNLSGHSVWSDTCKYWLHTNLWYQVQISHRVCLYSTIPLVWTPCGPKALASCPHYKRRIMNNGVGTDQVTWLKGWP